MSFLKWPSLCLGLVCCLGGTADPVPYNSTRRARPYHRRSWSASKTNLDGMQRVSIASASDCQLPRLARYDGSYSNHASRRGSKSEVVLTLEGDGPGSESTLSLARTSVLQARWTTDSLLELSNSVRQSLAEKKHFGPSADRLAIFLRTTLADETRGVPSIQFQTIKAARLDKLLRDITEFSKRPSALLTTDLGTIANAMSLQRVWRARLRAEYFTIDERRVHELVTYGRLKDVEFTAPNSLEDPTLCVWKPSRNATVPGPDTDSFVAGQWWLNIACACRDGIVDTEYEKPTNGQYGMTALPLLTGREDMLDGARVKYVRGGKLSDMHNSLITHTGQQIRILRGYRLKSIYAPSAGVRYDGLWKIVSYRQKLDDETNIYCLELTIEHAEGPAFMDAMTKIPQPSQLDDWQLYEKLETEKLRKTNGECKLLKWRLHREEDKLERMQWQRVCAFTSSISSDGTLVGRKLGSLSTNRSGATRSKMDASGQARGK